MPDKANRRWQIKSDFTEDKLRLFRNAIQAKADGQNVKTFVSGEWTLEYDLAHAGLAKDMWVAAHLAKEDDQINAGKKDSTTVTAKAESSFTALGEEKTVEERASHVYALFTTGKRASKAIAAQYLAERLENRIAEGELSEDELRTSLPPYLVSAIEYVTTAIEPDAQANVDAEVADD